MSSLMALIIVLAILMTIVGGETGIRSFFSVLINGFLLLLASLLIAWGANIIIIILIFVPLKLVTIIFLGTHDYTVAKSSFFASCVVCLVTSLIVIVMEHFSQAYGLGPEAGELLVGLSQMPGLNYAQIGIAVALFSTLGAVAEAAVAMSSGLLELKKAHPKIDEHALMKAGNEIGYDVLGTAMNTVLFGVFGSFLTLFLWYFRLNYSFGQMINDKMFVIEMQIMLYSLIGILMTVPLSTWTIAKGLSRKDKLNASKQATSKE
ncbi:MAG: YibE/F family protein [Lactobacillus sp.]|nr:YibE/F family protein [Lactobacillus sp.]